MNDEDLIFSIIADPAEVTAGVAAASGALDELGSVGEELGGVFESVGATIDAALSSVAETMASVAASVSGALGSLDGLASSADGVAGSMGGAGGAADALSGAMDAAAASAAATGAALDGVGASAETAATGMGDAAAGADATKASMATLDGSQLLMLGAVAGVAAGALIKLGADGEDALTRVQALTGASKSQMDQYSSAISGMAGTYGKSVSDLSGGLYDIVSVGYRSAGALATLKVASEAAAAGGTDLHTVTSGLTSIMKAYGVQGKNAASVMDLLLTGVRDGKASFQDYSNAIGLVATTARGAGFSLQESTAALSTLTAVFPNARRAGMDLQHLMTAIGVNAAATGKAARKMGLNFNQSAFDSDSLQQKLHYLQDITHGNQAEMLKLTGGTAGFAAAQVLLANKSADFTRNLLDMRHATGATQNAFDIWSHSIGAHAANVMGSLSAVADKVVVALGPAITGALDAVSRVFSGLSALFTQHSQAMAAGALVIAGALAGALAPSLWAVASAAATTAGAVLATAAPFILAGAAIVGIGLAVKYAYDHFAPFRHAVDAAAAALKQVGAQVMTAVVPVLRAAGVAVAQFGAQVLQRAGPAIRTIQAVIAVAMPYIRAIWNDTWPQIQTVFTTVWGVLQGVVKVAWAIISGVIKVGLDLLGGNWKQAWTDMQAMFKGVWDGIAQILGSVLLGMRNTFLNGLRPILQAVAFLPGPVGDMARRALGSIDALEKGADTKTRAMAHKTAVHAEAMRAAMLESSARMHLQSAAVFARQAHDIELQMRHTSDPVKRHALEMRLAMVKNAEEMQRHAAQKAMQMAASINASTTLMRTQARSHAAAMHSDLSGIFGQLARQAGTWGRDLVGNLTSGIQSMAGAVGNAAQNVASTISSFLHFSVPEQGPLASIEQWIPDMTRLLATGMRAQATALHIAARHVGGQIAGGLHTGLASGLSGASGLHTGLASGGLSSARLGGAGLAGVTGGGLYGGSATGGGLSGGVGLAALTAVIQQLRSAISRAAPLGPAPSGAALGAVTQQFSGGINFHGVDGGTAAALYAQLATLGGLALEDGQRGAIAGSAF